MRPVGIQKLGPIAQLPTTTKLGEFLVARFSQSFEPTRASVHRPFSREINSLLALQTPCGVRNIQLQSAQRGPGIESDRTGT